MRVPEFRKLARVGDVPQGQMVGVEVDGEVVAIANVHGRYYAFSSECTHAAGWLHEGFLEGCFVECPLHFARFDIRTGKATAPPAGQPIQTFRIRVSGEDLEVEYPSH